MRVSTFDSAAHLENVWILFLRRTQTITFRQRSRGNGGRSGFTVLYRMNGQKFSLSFNKRIEKKSLQPSALGSEGKAEVKQTPQALLAVDQESLKV